MSQIWVLWTLRSLRVCQGVPNFPDELGPDLGQQLAEVGFAELLEALGVQEQQSLAQGAGTEAAKIGNYARKHTYMYVNVYVFIWQLYGR